MLVSRITPPAAPQRVEAHALRGSFCLPHSLDGPDDLLSFGFAQESREGPIGRLRFRENLSHGLRKASPGRFAALRRSYAVSWSETVRLPVVLEIYKVAYVVGPASESGRGAGPHL
jgi:hypothetical protein